MDQNNNTRMVKWNKVADIKFVTDAFSGILAVGQSGICNPIEGAAFFKDTGFISCAPYFNGDILIADKTTIIETYESKTETKWPYDLIDVATIGTVTYIVAKFGDIFYSEEFGKFGKALSKYESFNSVNNCDPYFVMSGKHTIVIHDSRSTNRNAFRNITIRGIEFKSAYIYGETELVAFTADNRLMYMPDFTNMGKIYMTNISDIAEIEVNNIYIYHNNLYLLGNNGRIVMIKDFKLSDNVNDLEIYGARFGDTDWKSMLYKDDESNRTIAVGNGDLERSVLKIVNFENYIIENDMLNTDIVKRSYGHLASMMDTYTNGHVTYTFYNVMPDIDVLDKKFTISLASLLISRGYIENNDQVNNIDWSKSSVYVSVIDKTGTKTDTLYEYAIDDAGILTISLDKFVNGKVNILLLLGGDKI